MNNDSLFENKNNILLRMGAKSEIKTVKEKRKADEQRKSVANKRKKDRLHKEAKRMERLKNELVEKEKQL